jgi:hypothetical protein
MTTVDLHVIERREQAATKGPWAVGAGHDRILDDRGNLLFLYKAQETQALGDLLFVAYAKQDIPKLLAEVRKLKDELGVALAQLKELSKD